MATFIAGNRSTVTLGGNEVPVVTTSFDDNCKLVPIRNSMTSQNTIYIATFRDADISVFIDYNTAQPIYLSPFAIQSGTSIAAKIFLNQSGNDTLDGPYFNVTSMVISKIKMNSQVDGKIGWTITAKASGTYSYPST
jgi:hypothetical protein